MTRLRKHGKPVSKGVKLTFTGLVLIIALIEGIAWLMGAELSSAEQTFVLAFVQGLLQGVPYLLVVLALGLAAILIFPAFELCLLIWKFTERFVPKRVQDAFADRSLRFAEFSSRHPALMAIGAILVLIGTIAAFVVHDSLKH